MSSQRKTALEIVGREVLENIKLLLQICNNSNGLSITSRSRPMTQLEKALRTAKIEFAEIIEVLHDKNPSGSIVDNSEDAALPKLAKFIKICKHDLVPALFSSVQSFGGGFSGFSTGSENKKLTDILQAFENAQEDARDALSELQRRVERERDSSKKVVHFTSDSFDSFSFSNKHKQDDLKEHMQNSWFQKIESGRIVYVNVFDEDLTRREKPSNAFVKPLSTHQRKQLGKFDDDSDCEDDKDNWVLRKLRKEVAERAGDRVLNFNSLQDNDDLVRKILDTALDNGRDFSGAHYRPRFF